MGNEALLGLNDEDFADSVKRLLTRYKFTVKWVSEYNEFYNLVADPRYNLIIMDANLEERREDNYQKVDQVWEVVKGSVEQKQTSFLVLTDLLVPEEKTEYRIISKSDFQLPFLKQYLKEQHFM